MILSLLTFTLTLAAIIYFLVAIIAYIFIAIKFRKFRKDWDEQQKKHKYPVIHCVDYGPYKVENIVINDTEMDPVERRKLKDIKVSVPPPPPPADRIIREGKQPTPPKK